MMQLVKQMLATVLAAACASQALAQNGVRPDSKQPFEIVRSLEAIQDQIVLGNQSARAKLPKLIDQLAQRLLAADRDVWRDSRNARAAVVFTLSGGPARVIRKAVDAGLSPAPDLDLMRGALAYVDGRESEAKQILLKIDAESLPPPTGGHVAIIQSALIAKEDPRKAMRLLDLARISSPGTLIEETALRRELVVADEIADIDKFVILSREYFWRFPNSVYFESFRQRFAASVVHLGLASEPAQFAKVERLVGEGEKAGQLKLFLMIAKRSIVEGKASIARLAACKAGEMAAEGSADRAQSALYEAAALILSNQFEDGLNKLNTVDPQHLPRDDAELREAVLALASSISEDPAKAVNTAAAEPNGRKTADPQESSASASATALIDLVREKLAQADAALEGKQP
jgi:chemotaxis protein MotC